VLRVGPRGYQFDSRDSRFTRQSLWPWPGPLSETLSISWTGATMHRYGCQICNERLQQFDVEWAGLVLQSQGKPFIVKQLRLGPLKAREVLISNAWRPQCYI
jgi:hypothetical protein